MKLWKYALVYILTFPIYRLIFPSTSITAEQAAYAAHHVFWFAVAIDIFVEIKK